MGKYFSDKLARFGDLATFFGGKMNVIEILSPESVGPIGNKILGNDPEPLATLWILHAKLHCKYRSCYTEARNFAWSVEDCESDCLRVIWDITLLRLTAVIWSVTLVDGGIITVFSFL